MGFGYIDIVVYFNHFIIVSPIIVIVIVIVTFNLIIQRTCLSFMQLFDLISSLVPVKSTFDNGKYHLLKYNCFIFTTTGK